MIYAYTRPRYQVSVYRTIGPLVLVSVKMLFKIDLQYKVDAHSFKLSMKEVLLSWGQLLFIIVVHLK